MEGIFTPPDPNVEYECDPYTKSRGFTLLMKMVLLTKEYPELNNTIKEYIINNKEELNKQNERGWTALMLVCRNIRTKSSEDTLKVLIDAGCDLNLKDINNGWTALMYSCKYSSRNTVKMLIDAGCNLDLKDNEGYSALMLSCRYSLADDTENIVKMLIDAGCNLDTRDDSDRTLLILATKYFSTSSIENTVNILINQMKFITIRDHIKKTNYLNVIKHIPKLINDFKFKYGQLGQKIVTYHIQSKFKSKKELYEEIKLKDSKILDYLDIHSEGQLNKLEEYVYCT